MLCKTRKNTRQLTLAKDAGYKGTRNEGEFLFENISSVGVAQLVEHHYIHLILVRASAWDEGLILIQGAYRGQPIDVSLSLSSSL